MLRTLLFFALILLGVESSRAAEPPHVAVTPHKSPADERATFKVPDGFEVQLVAAEPDIAKPINMAFDARGRLWVTCTTEYPFPAKEGKGKDTIKILSDFGPDGRARKIETFADGLNIPIGILPYQNGCICYSIPNLWMLRDTDGDGKCDTREVLYSGFGTRDTHGMVNGLFMGFDGWVYANHGYLNDSKVKGKDGHEIKMNSGNVFRFKPDGSRVELFAKGQVNPFGSCMDKWGNLYTACCHSKPITMVMRGAVYESFNKPHDGLGFGPAMVHEYRGSTALCGLAWYEADYFPKDYQENFYLGDVVNNCINRFSVTWNGATPTAHQQGDLLTSTDPWFRPVDIELGPDGALYFADFYNRIIGHYEVDLKHPGRDRTSGRVWRIVRKDRAPAAIVDRWKMKTDLLVDGLESKNIAVRLTATNELVNRGRDAVQHLFDRRNSLNEVGRVHSFWVVERCGGWDGKQTEVLALAGGQDHEATSHELLLAHRFRQSPFEPKYADLALMALLHHGNPRVQRAAAEYIGGVSASSKLDRTEALRALALTFQRAENDPCLRHTLKIAMRNLAADIVVVPNLDRPVVAALAEVAVGIPNERGASLIMQHALPAGHADIKVPMSAAQVRHALRYKKWPEATISALIAKLKIQNTADVGQQCDLVVAFAEGLASRNEPLPAAAVEWADQAAKKALQSNKKSAVTKGIQVTLLTKAPAASKLLAELAKGQRIAEDQRGAAFVALVATSPNYVNAVLKDASESASIRIHAARALASLDSMEARADLAAVLPTAPGPLAKAIALGMVEGRSGSEALCEAVEKGKASARLLTDRTVRAKLEALGMKRRVDALTQGLPPLEKQIEDAIKKRRAACEKAKPDLAAGKELFTKHCAICHQVGGQGAKIGPQIDGIGSRGLDRLLEDVLDPHRNVDPNFRQTQLTLGDGRTPSGLFLREEGQTLVFADAQGKEFTVGKNNIEARNVSPLSAMPANQTDALKDEEFAALMGYLLSLKK